MDSNIPTDWVTTLSWSGSCAPDRYISGTGSLDFTGRDEGGVFTRRWSGQIVDGYWHGQFDVFYLEADGSRSQDEDTFTPRYNMGCSVDIQGGILDEGCVPATPSASGTPMATVATNVSDPPEDAADERLATFLSEQTGEACVTEQILPKRDLPLYFEYAVTVTNRCDRSFTLEFVEVPLNGATENRYMRHLGPNRSETYTCLEPKVDTSAAGLSGCRGFKEYRVE